MINICDICPFCSTTYSKISHAGPCPKVKSIEYFPDGRIKRVEFNSDDKTFVGGDFLPSFLGDDSIPPD